MRQLSNDQARRISLEAQGFGQQRPKGRVDRRHFRRVISKIGLLQLDSVNALQRSHYLPMWSRLGPYDVDLLDEYTARSGEMFEYWGHVASLMPSELHRLFRWRMDAMEPWRRVEGVIGGDQGYVESVLQEIASNGPLTVSDLRDPGDRTGPWWGHGKGKTALDWLFAKGKITAYRNKNFGRLYDVPSRVIPAEHLNADTPTKHEAYRELLLLGARHHGVGTATDIADYYRLNMPTARPILADMVAAGELEEVAVEGWDKPAYLHPDAKLPRRIVGATLLSPFDPVVWERDRALRLFGFHYKIEIYVPQPKRVYGYYVLPFMVDGQLVGRVDLKLDRKNRVLLAQASYREEGVDADVVAVHLGPELLSMSAWLGADDLKVIRKGNLAAALRSTL